MLPCCFPSSFPNREGKWKRFEKRCLWDDLIRKKDVGRMLFGGPLQAVKIDWHFLGTLLSGDINMYLHKLILLDCLLLLRKYAKAETLMTVTDPVHDIAFAPNLGRSFHILAVATKDVRIFTLKPLR